MQNTTYKRHWPQWLIPMLGSTCLTLLIIGTLFWFQAVDAGPVSRMAAAMTAVTTATTTTIPYQGYVTDSDGLPLSGQQGMTFKLYNQPTGGTPLWMENREGANRVSIDDGLFNVMLGSVTSLAQSVVTENVVLYLGVTIGADGEMAPRVQLGNLSYPIDELTQLNFLAIQHGRINSDHTQPDWELDEGTGNRQHRVTVNFDQNFDHAPHVMVSLNAFDFNNGANSRISVWPDNITPSGFDLVFSTWGDTILYVTDATWMAYTSP